ncbi:long-chain-fatty-acid--CoA ligase [Tianweitania sediminis]|uniref:Long-chain-fatty-acid--CoA ligase n=1 Tax=Tianweitania sediminis TaxID=1502156 RepID=A0A8J7QZE2_9HYPH|nr:long-chain-fatty-acid--CoA ligase [Tianweitania sediminis]MBP0437245.1 long-chain-fatty-acid--CoA ligase [Tianweitania sediminis]
MPAFENTAPAADKAATAEKAPAKPRTRSAKASASATETATNSKTAETIPAVEKPEAAPDAIDANAAAPTASAKPPASTPKPWLASYPPNVPADIVGLPADSLGAMIVAGCKTHGAKPAFTSMGKSLSFTDFAAESEAMAAYFQSLGLKKGARIALMMPNILQYPIALAGALRAGYVVVNVNPLYTARELEHQLNDSGAEAIVILENFANVLQRVVNNTAVRHVIVAAMGDLLGLKGFAVNLVVRRVKKMVPAWQLKNHVRFNAALKAGRGMTFKPVTVTADDLAFLQYTGGTTGVAKGAMLTHGNVLANVAQNAAWLESAFVKHKRPEQAVYLCALPLYHIYALTVNALTGIHLGSQNVLVANPRDIPALVKDFKQHKVNFFPGLNTLFNALLNNEDFKKLDFSALVLTFGGGMAVQQAVADRWQKLTGGVISEGYGLSETSPVATANPFDAEKFSGTIGLPLPSTEISIRNDNNEEVATGEAGEICIRGPQVMKGYWNRPDETAKVMTADGFLKSGDIGFMDEKGYTKIVDRKKDMILVSGFNVYPNEIEDVVARHPKVLEVAAVGVPDEKSGEVPKLFVVKKDASLTEDEVRSFCRENLTGYKRPRLIEFRDELPKTNVGKILRRELRG